MKMKKILSLTLSLAIVLMLNGVVQSEQVRRYLAYAEFEDYIPDLIHDEPRVEEVISCNMIVKPRTEVYLSRLCESAVANVKYYFNEDESNVQKGPDCNVEETGIYYPGTRLINNSYIGGTVSYKVSADFQTKKSDGEKIYMEVPVDDYQKVDIISSKTVYINMNEEYILSQPTGDQSQPNWIGIKQAYPTLNGYVNWTFRFGTIETSNVSGAFSLFKAKTQNESVTDGLCYTSPEVLNVFTIDQLEEAGYSYIDGVLYEPATGVRQQPITDVKEDICRRAKKFIMQYNLDPEACTSDGVIRTEEGWVEIAESQRNLVKVEENAEGKLILYYPNMMNAWGRIVAVLEIPEEGYRPAKRVRVKSRIPSYGGFKFNNLQEGDVVKIYNVSGKKVAELNSDFEWLGREGTNNSGDWAKSGIYIYQIKLKKDGKIISGTISFVW